MEVDIRRHQLLMDGTKERYNNPVLPQQRMSHVSHLSHDSLIYSQTPWNKRNTHQTISYISKPTQDIEYPGTELYTPISVSTSISVSASASASASHESPTCHTDASHFRLTCEQVVLLRVGENIVINLRHHIVSHRIASRGIFQYESMNQ